MFYWLSFAAFFHFNPINNMTEEETHQDGVASLTISNVRCFFLKWERHAASIGLCLTISKAVVNLRFHYQKS